MKVDDYTKEFVSWWLLILASVVVTISLLAFSLGAISDYWNGTAKASLIKKQTGIEYTWREAAQIKNMYDQNNVRISFDGDEKK